MLPSRSLFVISATGTFLTWRSYLAFVLRDARSPGQADRAAAQIHGSKPWISALELAQFLLPTLPQSARLGDHAYDATSSHLFGRADGVIE